MKGYVAKKGLQFYAVIYEGRDPLTGRERRRWHPAGTDERAARELAREIAASQANDHPRRSSLTLAVYLTQRWLPTKRLSLRTSTWDSYRRNIELHVLPSIGRIPLRHLRPDHLERLYAELRKNGRVDGRSGLSNKTVVEIHAMLRRALEDARLRGLLVTNPAAVAHAPKRRPLESAASRSWTADQLRSFLDTAKSSRLYPALRLAAYTGMRRGELLGLRWSDVDLVGGRISVDRSLISVGYELHETRGKTRTARRSIDLDSSSIAVLDQWLQLRREENPSFRRESDDYVFAHPDGSPIHPQVLSDAFKKLVQRSRLPRIRFHDLRHTHATLLLKARVPIKVVSERLGHSTPGFTMATYQHVLPGMQADAARTETRLAFVEK
jgi:integrase